jgi:hypothetical protein
VLVAAQARPSSEHLGAHQTGLPPPVRKALNVRFGSTYVGQERTFTPFEIRLSRLRHTLIAKLMR